MSPLIWGPLSLLLAATDAGTALSPSTQAPALGPAPGRASAASADAGVDVRPSTLSAEDLEVARELELLEGLAQAQDLELLELLGDGADRK